MKIKINNKLLPFSYLKQGDVFKYGDTVYIKTNEIELCSLDVIERFNCVDLESGNLCGINKTIRVEPLFNAVLKTEE